MRYILKNSFQPKPSRLERLGLTLFAVDREDDFVVRGAEGVVGEDLGEGAELTASVAV